MNKKNSSKRLGKVVKEIKSPMRTKNYKNSIKTYKGKNENTKKILKKDIKNTEKPGLKTVKSKENKEKDIKKDYIKSKNKTSFSNFKTKKTIEDLPLKIKKISTRNFKELTDEQKFQPATSFIKKIENNEEKLEKYLNEISKNSQTKEVIKPLKGKKKNKFYYFESKK